MGVRTQFEMSVTDIDIGRGEEEIWGFVSQWGLARVPLLSPRTVSICLEGPTQGPASAGEWQVLGSTFVQPSGAGHVA